MSLFARITFIPSLAFNLIKNRWSNWNWFDRIDEQLVLGALPFHGPVTYQLYHNENIRSVVSMNENFELKYFVTNQNQWICVDKNFKYLQLNTSDIFHAPTIQQLIVGVDFIQHQQNQLKQQRQGQERKQKFSTEQSQQQELRSKILFQEPIPFRLLNWPIKNHDKILKCDRFNYEHNCDDNSSDPIVPDDCKPSIYVHCKAGRTRSATLVACYLIKQYKLTPKQSIDELKKFKRKQILLHQKQLDAIEDYYKFLLTSNDDNNQNNDQNNHLMTTNPNTTTTYLNQS